MDHLSFIAVPILRAGYKLFALSVVQLNAVWLMLVLYCCVTDSAYTKCSYIQRSTFSIFISIKMCD